MDRTEDPEEDFLGQVEGFVVINEEVERQLMHHPLVLGDELAARVFVSGGATLHEHRFAAPDVRPGEGASWLHRKTLCHLTTPAPASDDPRGDFAALDPPGAQKFRFCYDKRVRRGLLITLTLATLLAGLAYAYTTLTQERSYRRQIEAGNAALAVGQTFEAIEAFSGAIALKGDSMLAYLRRGEAYQQQGQLQAAERDLRRAWRLDPAATRPLEALGDVRFETQNYARAAERYADYVALDDRSPRILYKLALARYRAGDPAGSVEPLTKAVSLDEGFSEAQYLLGLCLRETGRPDEAMAALQRAVALSPAFIVAREELADLCRETGRITDELDQLEALSSLDPRPVRRIALGLAQARVGRHNQAILTLGQAAERYPEHAGLYVALGRVWLETSQGGRDRIALSKALEALQDAAAGSDDSHEARALFGRALLQASAVEMAERVLQQAVARLPVDPQAFLSLADAAEQLGHLADARAALLKYQALVGDDPSGPRQVRRATRIGDLSIRLSDYPAAVEWYSRAAEAAPPSARLLTQLAQAQVSAGESDAARATVERGLVIEPNNRALLAVARKLR